MNKLMYLLLLLLVLVGCSQKELTRDDELLFELQDINDEELAALKERVTIFTEEELKQNYATIVFDYHVKNGKKFNKLTVEHQFNWGNFMDEIGLDDFQKFMNGNGRTTNFRNGSFEQDSNRFVFYTKDFTDEQMQEIFSKYALEIGWMNDEGRWVNEIIPVGSSYKDKRGE
ncbi:hypothetical protein NSQ62_09640 [Solibacillus sp. FSL H8-0523]|uniref:hypothetical protein n=1 Tax=Solibacillus sp. FSL H8-0523 TaxID=2954511 RepID=UPI003101282A